MELWPFLDTPTDLGPISCPLVSSKICPNPDPGQEAELNPTLATQQCPLSPNPISSLPPDISTAFSQATASADAAKKNRKKKKNARSAEMVRVSSMRLLDCIEKRNEVKKTRRTYEALALVVGDEDNKGPSKGAKRNRADLTAGAIMRSCDLWLNRDRRIVGAIPGINIGDVFFFRFELCVVGLHGLNQAGIDYVHASSTPSGVPIATSIVVSGGYEDDEDSGHELIYTGEGGREKNLVRHNAHQRLEGANLAMEKSMENEIEVRVIRGLKCEQSPTGRVYVYDGLYKIVECWPSIGKSGFSVYKNKLVRIEGQEEMGSSMLKLAEELKVNPFSARPTGYLSLDMSNKKEKVPVLLFNDIDGDHEPLLYEYLASPVYPYFVLEGGSSLGCRCVSKCSIACPCAERNGGQFAYDENGILLKGKPLVYECGKWCSCDACCPNRVSQKGVRRQLEVFRSEETGWGVRSLDLIRAGSFICELSGIILSEQQSKVAASMHGCSLIDPGNFPATWKEWGDISAVFPEYVPPDYPQLPKMSFSLDVSRVRNVGCYLSHSCSPNVFVQPVLFDHCNVFYPHLMIFAMENIPPLREMSINYGVYISGMGY